MHFGLAAAGSWVVPTHTGQEALAFLLRWFHIIAGILWVGLLYFFNLVNVPFMKQVDASMKPKVLQYMTLPALHLFRWSSLVTVLVGFMYWGHSIVGTAARNATAADPANPKGTGGTIGLFLLVWIVTALVLYLVISRNPSGYVLGVITALLVVLASWLFCRFTPLGADDNRVLSIGIGGGLGIVMLFNVWGIIWRNNKKVIKGTLAGNPPENAAVLSRQAFLASRVNFVLSLPMLFFMAASSHYVVLGG